MGSKKHLLSSGDQESEIEYEGLPFSVILREEKEQVRHFRATSNSGELDWHRDREDRIVSLVSGTGWLIQLDNELPVPIEFSQEHLIPSGTWHRIIRTKQATDIVLRIKLLV